MELFFGISYQTQVANRDQVCLEIDLEHLKEHDDDLCQAVLTNTKRYLNIVSDAVHELLPQFKTKEVLISYTA